MTTTSLGRVLSAVWFHLRCRTRSVVRRTLILAMLIGAATVPLWLCLKPLGSQQGGASTPLPFYALTVLDSHCDHSAELVKGTLRLRPGAMLDVTLVPDSFVQGEVTLRSFVEYPQLPPIHLPLLGEQTPSRAGTFHLRGSVEVPLNLRPGRARLLFVLSRPSGLLKTHGPVRQVLELPIEVLSD